MKKSPPPVLTDHDHMLGAQLAHAVTQLARNPDQCHVIGASDCYSDTVGIVYGHSLQFGFEACEARICQLAYVQNGKIGLDRALADINMARLRSGRPTVPDAFDTRAM